MRGRRGSESRDEVTADGARWRARVTHGDWPREGLRQRRYRPISGRAATTYLASPRRISEVRWTDWYTIASRGDSFPPLARRRSSSRRSLSFSPSFFHSRVALLRPSRSHAHTHIHTPLARFSARLPQIFISGSTANSGRTGRSARDRPGFLTVLTANGYRRRCRASSYIRATCVPAPGQAAAAPAVAERRRVSKFEYALATGRREASAVRACYAVGVSASLPLPPSSSLLLLLPRYVKSIF